MKVVKESPSMEALKDLLYPLSDGLRYWGGWEGFFEPSIPSRLHDEGFDAISDAFKGKPQKFIDFLDTAHLKKLSKAGRGQSDVLCVPTEKAELAVQLLSKIGFQRNAHEVLRKIGRGKTGLHFMLEHEGTKTEFKVIEGEYDAMFVQWDPFKVYEHYSHLPGVVDGTAGICILD